MGERRHGHGLLGEDDSAVAHGAALGTLGVGGWFAWRRRRRMAAAIDGVSPGTRRGALNVSLWFLGLLAVGAAAAAVLPAIVALVVAIVVMVAVGRWWDRRAAGRAGRVGPFA